MSSRVMLLAAAGSNPGGSNSTPVSVNVGISILEAALSAAVFAGSTRLIYGTKEPLLGKTNLINAGVLGGSVVLNELSSGWLRSMLPSVINDATNYIVNPLVVGAYYSLITSYVTKTDNRSMLVKVLHGAASNMIAKNIEQPVRKLVKSS